MTRKLASIQRIKDLLPIPGADRIELAIINGWQVVTQKGQHAVGDLIVFYEIDSFLSAEDPRYASFEERFINWGDKRGMRLKTIKLRKQLSQGLIMPVRNFEELKPLTVSEGMDVTEVLKIEKWEPIEKEYDSTGNQKAQKTRAFPFFLRKTDQERVQNYGHMIAKALDDSFEVTVKKDGSSMTVFRVDPESPVYAEAKKLLESKLSWWKRLVKFVKREQDQPLYGICSRNVLLPLEGNSNFHKAAEPVLAYLRSGASLMIDGSVALQGEVVAPDIQGNYEKVDGVEFHLFDIFDIDKQQYMLPVKRRLFAAVADINHVKVVDKGTLRSILQLKEGEDPVQKALTYASGPGDNLGVDREGVVFKADDRDFSFKAVSNEYLLATGK